MRRTMLAVAPAVCVLLLIACSADGATTRAGPFAWSAPRVVVHPSVVLSPVHLAAISCPSAAMCVGVGASSRGGVVETSGGMSGATAWHGAVLDGSGLLSVSCPSAQLCVALGADGDLWTSSDPAGPAGAWSAIRGVLAPPEGEAQVSCPTVTLCVAVDDRQTIFSSTNPADGQSWKSRVITGSPGALPYAFGSVSCPDASFCVVADDFGRVLDSAKPGGAGSTWTGAAGSPPGAESVSCASDSLCVGTDGDLLLVSGDPSGGQSTWRQVDPAGGSNSDAADSYNQMTAVSCSPAGLCAAVDNHGTVFRATDPGGGRNEWVATGALDPAGFTAVSCQAGSLCVAAGANGSIASSSAPSAPLPRWTVGAPLGVGNRRAPVLTGVSCASASLCVAADTAGAVLHTTRPRDPATWVPSTINPAVALNSISCPSTHFCAATGGADGYVATTAHPTGTGPSWDLVDLDLFSFGRGDSSEFDPLTDIGCAPSRLCAAARDTVSADNLEVSRDPLLGAGSWHAEARGKTDSTADTLRSISCPSSSLCLAAGARPGTVAVSTDGAQDWRFPQVEAVPAEYAPTLDAVSCPNTRFCAAVDTAGNVLTTTHPASDHGRWRRTSVDRHHRPILISCASASFCAIVDRQGYALTTDEPAADATRWHRRHVGTGATGLSCPTARLCVISTKTGAVIAGGRR